MAKKKIIRKFSKKTGPGNTTGPNQSGSMDRPGSNENQGRSRFRPPHRNENPRSEQGSPREQKDMREHRDVRENRDNREGRDNRNRPPRGFHPRDRNERDRNERRERNEGQSRNERYDRPERREKVLLGKCFLCQANISDDIYGLKMKNGEYIHFECMVKYVKNLTKNDFPQRDIKVYYTGSGNFSLVMEKKFKGTIKWEVLKTINIKQIETSEKVTS